MAGKAGPYVNNDGLVFHYDTGNTVRSFKGEPTTNIITPFPSTVLPAGVVWTYEYATEIVDAPISNHFLSNQKWVKFTKTSSTNGRAMFLGGSFTAGNTYTWTMYVYCDDNRNTSFAMGSDNTNNSQTTTSTGYNFSQLGTVQRIRGTWNQLLNGGSIFGVRGGASNPIGSTIYVTGLQCEQKANPTQLTTGTRSATQGLLDLKGNSTIDLTNVSFDSNAQMTFDGTNDYIEVPNTNLPAPGSNHTLECVFQRNSGRTIINYGPAANGASKYYNLEVPGSVLVSNLVTSAGSSQLVTSITISSNKWYHGVLSYNGSTMSLYVNGVLAASTTTSGDIPSTSTPSLNIGRKNSGNGEYINGKVGLTKIYSRALTASEVERNFNAVRTRFGI